MAFTSLWHRLITALKKQSVKSYPHINNMRNMCSLSRKVTYFYITVFLTIYFTALLWRRNNAPPSFKSINNSKLRNNSIPKNKSETKSNQTKNVPQRKTILFLPRWWQKRYPYLDEANRFCPKCHFTENQKYWNVSDAVVFHGRILPEKIPSRRKPGEIWVFMMFEALAPWDAKNITRPISRYDGLFNWTMTYRKDSDIPVPYGRFVKNSQTKRPNFTEMWAYARGAAGDKTYAKQVYSVTPSIANFKNRSLIAWIVSRCNSSNQRQDIVTELRRHVPIDIYGECGDRHHTCAVPKGRALSGIDCRLQIHTRYKFYIAFENANCLDYVTEKYFDVLSSTDMVPIVYGGANYKESFPKGSFIDVRDYKGAKELGQYLKYLGNTPKKWLDYFTWRKDYWVQNNRFVTGYCDLCKKVWEFDKLKRKNKSAVTKSYAKIWDWWIYKKNADKASGLACESRVRKWKNK